MTGRIQKGSQEIVTVRLLYDVVESALDEIVQH